MKEERKIRERKEGKCENIRKIRKMKGKLSEI